MPFPPTGPSHCVTTLWNCRGVESPSFSKQIIGFMTTNARNWQNRGKLSKPKCFDCSDVVNCPPKHSEFSVGRPMFGCGNWWKLYQKFEKYVVWKGKYMTLTSGIWGTQKDWQFSLFTLKRPNYLFTFIVMNLIANWNNNCRIAVFTKIVSFYWFSHAYFSKYLKRLRRKQTRCRFIPAYHVRKEMWKCFFEVQKYCKQQTILTYINWCPIGLHYQAHLRWRFRVFWVCTKNVFVLLLFCTIHNKVQYDN